MGDHNEFVHDSPFMRGILYASMITLAIVGIVVLVLVTHGIFT